MEEFELSDEACLKLAARWHKEEKNFEKLSIRADKLCEKLEASDVNRAYHEQAFWKLIQETYMFDPKEENASFDDETMMIEFSFDDEDDDE